MTPNELDQFIRRWLALQTTRKGVTDRGAAALDKLLQRMQRDLIALLAEHSNGSGAAIQSEAHLRQILDRMDRQIGQSLNGAGRLYQQSYQKLIDESAKGIPSIYMTNGSVSVQELGRKLQSTRRLFMREVYAKDFPVGFADWMDELGRVHGAMRGDMERTLLKAQLNNWQQTDIARDLLQSPNFTFEGLPREEGARAFYQVDKLGENKALRNRANVIAKTKLNAINTQANKVWADEVELEYFINVNSDPVSAICKAANAAGARTWKQWQESPEGLSPRHPRCDSFVAAILTDDVPQVNHSLRERAESEPQEIKT